MGSYITSLLNILFAKKLEICLLGLENTGKTTFVDSIMGVHKQNLPTIGLNVKQVKKGSKKIIYNNNNYRFKYENLGYRRTISI